MRIEHLHDSRLHESVVRADLPVGLRVEIMPKPGFRKQFAILGVRYGSIDTRFVHPESGRRLRSPEGVAHFLEHQLFQQEEGDAMTLFARNGASANAATSNTCTYYLFGGTRDFAANLGLLLDMVAKLRSTPQKVEREKAIIEQELLMYEDDAPTKGSQVLMEALYHKHPVREDIGGSVASVRGTTLDDLRNCHDTFYHPSNMGLFLSGDVAVNAVLDQVGEFFDHGRWKSRPPIARPLPREPRSVACQSRVLSMDVSTPQLNLGVKAAAGVDEQALLARQIPLNLFFELQFQRGGRIFDELYDADLIGDDFSAYHRVERSFAYSILGGESRAPEKLADLLVRELCGLKDGDFDPERFARKKKQAFGHFLHRFNRTEGCAYHLLHCFFKDIDPFDWPRMLEAVGIDQVRAVCRDHFRPEAFARVIVHPKRRRAPTPRGPRPERR